MIYSNSLSILLLLLINYCNAGLSNFDENFVLNFMSAVINSSSVTYECMAGLLQVAPFLSSDSAIPEQREFFYSSYTKGKAEQFSRRDLDRWIYRAYECMQAAGETYNIPSNHPLEYCYGYNDDVEDTSMYGICLPSECNNEAKSLIEQWQSFLSTERNSINFASCTRSRHILQWYERPLPLAEFILLQFFILIIIIATVYHMIYGDYQKSTYVKILLSFSAKKNVKKLLTMPKDRQSTITCMFGMRFLSMVWTLIGHSFVFVQAYIKNVDDFKDDMVDNFSSQWIANFTLSVDTFFVLSATLTAFTWFRRVRQLPLESIPTWNSWAYWLRFYRHRIIRLWPAYIYIIVDVGMRSSVQYFHPMWSPIDPSVQCPGNWWKNVFFINSLTDNRCLPWTWYIGTEFIFYLLSPIFILLLYRTPAMGVVLSLIMIIGSCILRTFPMIKWNFPPTQLFWKQPAIFNDAFLEHHIYMYIKPQYRIGPYVIGLLLGYYLSDFQTHENIRPRSALFQFTGWFLATVAGFWAIFGVYPSVQGWDWPVYHIVYGSIHRTVFALSMAWLIYACYTGIGGIIDRILSMSILIPLASLSYVAYLIHMVPVVLTYLMMPFPVVYNDKLFIFMHCIIQLSLSYLFGAAAAFVAELPALNLERIAFSDNRIKSLSLRNVQTNQETALMK